MKEGLAYFTDTQLTAVGLLIFFGFFIGVLFWISRKNSKALYDYMESMPLQDGETR